MSLHRPAVFFDRDDTLMVNVPYLGEPDHVQLMPGATEALRVLEGLGLALFIVSNQSGVGRGLITPEQVRQVNQELVRQLGHVVFKEIYSAFAEPEADKAEGQALSGDHPISDRKPSPQILFRAAREHGLDLAHSFFIGDRLADVLCGRNAGCRTVLVRAGENAQEWERAGRLADFSAADLTEASNWIAAQMACKK